MQKTYRLQLSGYRDGLLYPSEPTKTETLFEGTCQFGQSHLSSRIGNPLALAGGGKSALLNESIAFFFEKTLDIFSKMWFNRCITLADICSITAPFPVTGGDPGNVSAYPLQRG